MNEKTKDEAYYKAQFWNNLSCLPISIGIAIIILAFGWALAGFPGL